MTTKIIAACVLATTLLAIASRSSPAENTNPATAPAPVPIEIDQAGRGGDIASRAVVRLLCPALNSASTGFLHKSGNIITAANVVQGCGFPAMVLEDGNISPVTTIATDADHDLALVKPSVPLNVPALPIASSDTVKVGGQVSTWGFPSGYFGLAPILGVGYVAGIDTNQVAAGKSVRQWIVNAPFNGGNSGGPLIQIETGEVIGVVSTKLAPLTADTAAMLRGLENSTAGPVYTGNTSDGKPATFTEGQLIAKVVNELRRQVQLVVGKAVVRDDLVNFLKANNIEP
jgi:S1-C subfamily serine protease